MTRNKKKLKDNERCLEEEFDADSRSDTLTAEEISEKYTVAELKDILRENGLKVSGRKQELVERVLPVLNSDSGETSDEDASYDSELTEKTKAIESKKEDLAQTGDSSTVNDVDLPSPVNDELLSSTLSTFGINYDDLAIKDKIHMVDNLNIQGFTQNGLSMSDSTMSVVNASDSKNVNLKMNIPEVSYTDFKSTIFTFKNLDLFVLPSSNPKSLEFSTIMDSLEIITETDYVNLKGLNFFFKSLPDKNGLRIDIGIDNFIYPAFNNTSFNFENLDFNISIGLNGQSLAVSVNLPTINLINKNYKVNLSDLYLNIALPDLKLANLDLSILIPDFHYTNFDDLLIDMNDVDVSLEPIINSNSFNVIVRMDGLNAIGLNSLDELFPMLNITGINFKNSTTDLDSSIKLTGLVSPLDIFKMDLSDLVSILSSGFNIKTYTSNMPDQNKTSTDDADISTTEVSELDNSGFDLASVFENCDYSCLGALVLDLSGLVDSLDIDLSEFGIDLSGYDLSSIGLSDLIDVISNSDFITSAVTAILQLFSLDLNNIDISDLLNSFDSDNFDVSGLLASLNLSELDVSGILEMFNSSDAGLAAVFENCDYSCLGAVVLDLSGLIDSLGIDLSELDIDLSGYDLSAISLSDLIDVISNSNIDTSTIIAMLKIFDLNLQDIDTSGLISSFDSENFDVSGLLASLNLSELDVSGILEMFNSSDAGLAAVFENCDYSCLGAVVLDLSGLIDSLGIDLSELDIDLSGYDLSAISLSNLIDVISNLNIDMSVIMALLKLFGLDLEDVDVSGLIATFDPNNFDVSSLLASLNLSELDISGIGEMFSNLDVDLAAVFENCDYSCLGAVVLDLSGLVDSLGIDLFEFGIDLSGYDLSAISLSDLIDVLTNSEFIMSTITAMLKLFSIDLDNLDMSGLIASFDSENFDISGLLNSLNLSELDISGILDMFNRNGFDLTEFLNNILSLFIENMVSEDTHANENE